MRIYKKSRITGDVTPVFTAYDGCEDGSLGAEEYRLNSLNTDPDVYYVRLSETEAERLRGEVNHV